MLRNHLSNCLGREVEEQMTVILFWIVLCYRRNPLTPYFTVIHCSLLWFIVAAELQQSWNIFIVRMYCFSFSTYIKVNQLFWFFWVVGTVTLPQKVVSVWRLHVPVSSHKTKNMIASTCDLERCISRAVFRHAQEPWTSPDNTQKSSVWEHKCSTQTLTGHYC